MKNRVDPKTFKRCQGTCVHLLMELASGEPDGCLSDNGAPDLRAGACGAKYAL